MGTKLGEVFVEFALKGNPEKLKELGKDVATMPISVAATIAAFTGLSLSFIGLTHDTLEMAQGLRTFKAETGETTDYLERWETVARRVGLSNDVVKGSFQSMIQSIQQLKTFGTGNAAELFGRLGIAGFMQKSPDQLMNDLREAYHRMGPKKFESIAGGLINPQMALAFESPMSAPESLKRINPLLGKEGIETSADFIRALSELTDVIRVEFIGVFKKIEPDMGNIAKFLGFIVETLGSSVSHGVQLAEFGKKAWNYGVSNLLEGLVGNIPGAAMKDSWKPGKSNITVNQHYYGDVDKFDIDAGTVSLKNTLLHTSRLLNKGGR